MTKLSPKRLEEIKYFNLGNAPWETQTWMSPAIKELLSHIAAQEQEIADLKSSLKFKSERNGKNCIERDSLRAKLEKAKERFKRCKIYSECYDELINEIDDALAELEEK